MHVRRYWLVDNTECVAKQTELKGSRIGEQKLFQLDEGGNKMHENPE